MPRKTKDFAEAIRRKLAADPHLAAAIEDERFGMSVGSAIYEARIEAGMTQAGLAKKIGSHQSVIARMEDADYDGHTLAMLKRIGDALGKRLHVEFRSRFADAVEQGSAEVRGLPRLQWPKRQLAWTPVFRTSGSSQIVEQPHDIAA